MCHISALKLKYSSWQILFVEFVLQLVPAIGICYDAVEAVGQFVQYDVPLSQLRKEVREEFPVVSSRLGQMWLLIVVLGVSCVAWCDVTVVSQNATATASARAIELFGGFVDDNDEVTDDTLFETFSADLFVAASGFAANNLSCGESVANSADASVAFEAAITREATGMRLVGSQSTTVNASVQDGCQFGQNTGSALARIDIGIEVTGQTEPLVFRMRQGLSFSADSAFSDASDLSVSVSFGVALFPGNPLSAADAIVRETVTCSNNNFSTAGPGVCTPQPEYEIRQDLPPGRYTIRIQTGGGMRIRGDLTSSADFELTVGKEGCDLGWDNPAGGNWFTQENWDKNKVPLDRGEGCDNVFFDRLGTAYTVTNPSDAATANTLSVTADNVTLQDGGLVLAGAPSDLAPSNALTVDDAGLLHLLDYTIATPSVLVDSNLTNPGRHVLIVDSGASLNVAGRILLGSDFGGQLLDVRQGGTINSGQVEIGKSGNEETLARVAGAWTMQRLELGVLGDARVLIESGGKVQVSSTDFGAILGSVPGVLGTIELQNLNSELLLNGPLELGSLGKGVASVKSGAKLIASACNISGDDSQLNVDGAAGNVSSLAQINGNLNVATGNGVGSLNITNGGLVQVSGNALLGESNIAFLLLEGQDPTLGFGAQMLVDGELILGQGTGAAKVSITNGGTLSATNGLKLSSGSQVSTIVMEKGAASADTPPNLVAGDFAHIGVLGKGEIFASDGATLNFSGATTLGLESSGFGIVELNGVSPDTNAPTKLAIDGQLDIGFHGQGLLRLNDGAQVEVASAVFIGGLSTDTASAGALGLTNENSALNTSFTAAEDIFIGGNDSFVDLVGSVRLRSDNRILLERNGKIFMTQNAVLSQQNGFIQRGGRIFVGAAQGNKQVAAPATIEGDWSIEDPASIIELNAADAISLLRVTGNVSLGGRLEIRFADGIELNTDDLLGLIQFDGAISGSFANISFPNRSSDFVGEIVTNGDTLQLRVIVPGEPIDEGGEGEGEGEEPPVGCGGCNEKSFPIGKNFGDALAFIFGMAVLLGTHFHFRKSLLFSSSN